MDAPAITVTPVSGALGADVTGIDLSAPLSNTQWDSIHRAFLDHHVLRFNGQNVTPSQHEDFAKRFGPIVPYPFGKGIEGHPDVLEIRKNPTDKRNFGGTWHSDTTYLPVPPLATMLVARETPPIGGDTLFMNTHLAYEALSNGMKAMLANLKAFNSSNKRYRTGSRAAQLAADTGTALKDPEPGVQTESTHPVVRTHPETGRKSLYINRAHTINFDGWTEPESKPMLDYLFRHMERPDFQCRMSWQEGTLIIWDNRSTQHFAADDYAGHTRVMHRVTIAGDMPV